MLKREHGRVSFFVIKDGTGRLQLFLVRAVLGEQAYARCWRWTWATSSAPRAP